MSQHFLLDQNISHRVIMHLNNEFESIHHVKDFQMEFASDREIWSFAATNNYDIITKDSDFNEIASYFNTNPRIIWLRIGNATTPEIAALLLRNKDEIYKFVENNPSGILEIRNSEIT